MKHFYLIVLFSLSVYGFSQSTLQFINYQAVLRDVGNEPFAPNTTATITIDLFNSINDVNPVYSEFHAVTIPQTYIINLRIGAGNQILGTFSSVVWSTGNAAYAIKVNASVVVPKQRFAYVPYAFYAETSGNPKLYKAGNGISISNDTIKNTAPQQSVSITGTGVSGTYPSYVINASAGTTSLTQGNNIILNGAPSTYTISSPTYSLTFPSFGQALLTNGVSTTTASFPSASLTLSGNLLSAGTNSVALTSYTGGNGISINGTPPNLGISVSTTGTNAAWNTLGNSGTNSSINYLGTSDNADVVFKTNGSQRMIMKSNGNIGVGANLIPTENLQVESFGNSTVSIVSSTLSYLNFGNSTNHALGGIRYDNFSNAMSFSTNSNTRLQIDGNGRVGIGIVPLEPLHVVGKTRTDSIQIRGPVTPTIQSVLVSRDNQGNAKWAAPVNFKGNFVPTTSIAVSTGTQSNIGNIINYSSGVIFNNSLTGGLVYNNLGGFYTVPETGVYHFDASIMVSINGSATGNNNIALEIFNSTTTTILQRVMQSNSDAISTMHTVLKASTTAMVAKGDVITLRVMGSTATCGFIQNSFPQTDKMNSFSGFLIR